MSKNINVAINTLRTLSIDMINKANSGHPGICLGAAPMMYTLYRNHLNATPTKSDWFNRDRFVMAAGHGSALLYSMLHVAGYDLTVEDLKQFRQLGSKTPGHPEFGHTDGVDATSGPLGQGIPMAVGFALSEKFLSAKYNVENVNVVDHYTYALCGDGDLMEGITMEAASLAGHLKLGKLVVLYDSNDISLDGDLSLSYSENTAKKFEAMNWQVIRVEDGNDVEAINDAISKAKAVADKPTLIEIKTIIGYGAEGQGTSGVHGKPLGADGAVKAKSVYEWGHGEFTVPSETTEDITNSFAKRGSEQLANWNENVNKLKSVNKELGEEFEKIIAGNLTVDLSGLLEEAKEGFTQATRNSSQTAINKIADAMPTFIGGAADLSGSNMTTIKNESQFTPSNPTGRNVYFGVREHAMAAIANGMVLHGGVRVFVATFFVFSDYLKHSVRMSALMNLPTIYVFTHDSIAVGEDGPTHEPIEQLAMFRAMPNVTVLRPCDTNETYQAWQTALDNQTGPTVLVLTRQGLDTVTSFPNVSFKKGAYIVKDTPDADGIIIATGSEVGLALESAKALENDGHKVRVVSMPSWELFEQQSTEYKESVLPKTITRRFAIEMACPIGWERYVGFDGAVLGMETFGASGPANEVINHFGFTVENVVNQYKKLK